jgi:hypothetical protein
VKNPTYPNGIPVEEYNTGRMNSLSIDRVTNLEERMKLVEERQSEMDTRQSVTETTVGFSNSIVKLAIPLVFAVILSAIGGWISLHIRVASIETSVTSENSHTRKEIEGLRQDVNILIRGITAE